MRVTDTMTTQRFGRQSIYDCSTPLFRWYSMWKNKIYIYCIKTIVYHWHSPRMWPRQFFYGPREWTERENIFFTQMNSIPS